MSHVPGDKYLDCITLGGVKGVPVPQEGGHSAFIEMSRTVNRSASLYAFDFPAKITRRHWSSVETPAGMVWCSGCGEWHEPGEFSEDKRNKKTGLQSHCKKCHAKHERMMYALRKESRLIHAAKAITQGRVAYAS